MKAIRMGKDKKQRDAKPAKDSALSSVAHHEDVVFVEAVDAIGRGLREYIESRVEHSPQARILLEDFSDGLLISVLKLIGPEGKFPMEKGRFWQILDRHYPFSGLVPASKVLALTISAWRENVELKRIDQASLVQLVADAVRRGRIALEKLRPKLRDDVRSRLEDNRDDVRKPK